MPIRAEAGSEPGRPKNELGVRISAEEGRIVSVMELESPNDGLGLERIESALLQLRIQVLSSQSRRTGGHFVHRLRVTELDGGRIPDWRRPRLVSALAEVLGVGRAKYLDARQSPVLRRHS